MRTGIPRSRPRPIHELISRSIDGVVFVESWLRGSNPTLDLASKPYVFVHRLFSDTVGNSVQVDEHYGSRVAVDHLAGLGHRRIAYINGPRNGLHGWDASTGRLAGYRGVLSDRGIDADPALVMEGDWEVESGYSAARRLLAVPDRPTAVFAANDLMALGAIYAIRDAGLRVPEDVAVVGYDDREIAGLVRPAIRPAILEVCSRTATVALLTVTPDGGCWTGTDRQCSLSPKGYI